MYTKICLLLQERRNKLEQEKKEKYEKWFEEAPLAEICCTITTEFTVTSSSSDGWKFEAHRIESVIAAMDDKYDECVDDDENLISDSNDDYSENENENEYKSKWFMNVSD